jgi:hypothetical protein
MANSISQGTKSTPIPVGFPPVLYLPCTESNPHDGKITIELRQTDDGRMALMAYSALDRLVSCCGDSQPWAVVPTTNLDKVHEANPFELVLLDVAIPEEFRHGGSAG